MRVLGVIPARGGSKGVVNKNVRLVGGEPLIAYSIRAAQESGHLTDFLTTTDSENIARIAMGYHSPILMRPAGLALDDSPVVGVVLHALREAELEAGQPYDAVVLLQPTSPIRTGEDVDNVIAMLRDNPEIDGVISVCPMDDVHPARMYRLDGDEWMDPLCEELETARRQALPVVYYRNGALYAVRRSVVVDRRTLMAKRKKAYVMPREHLANIDDERDLVVTDALVRLWKEGRL